MKTRLHRSEVMNQLGKLRRCGGPDVSVRAIENALGYPLSEAGMDDLRGIIAALTAVVDQTYADGPAVSRESMAGVWTAIVVDQTGGVHQAPAPDPEPYHRIMVVRAMLDASDVDEIQHRQVLYEAQGWKDPAVEWAEAQAVAAALNAATNRKEASV